MPDFLVPQLIASVSTPVRVVVTPALPAPDTSEPGEMQMAAIGGGAKPLRTVFAPVWPTRGLITTHFGELAPTSPRGHAGLDIAGPSGTPILAADDGEVLKAYWNQDGYGGLVVIAHASGYETWYGHMSRFSVSEGDRVTRGQQIGGMGSTGFSTGPHLHFEVRQEGALTDPLKFLSESALQDADW